MFNGSVGDSKITVSVPIRGTMGDGPEGMSKASSSCPILSHREMLMGTVEGNLRIFTDRAKGGMHQKPLGATD